MIKTEEKLKSYWKLAYSVGALLYSPANREEIAAHIAEEKYGNHYSLALCLEDAISDWAVEDAEAIAANTVLELSTQIQEGRNYVPKTFIRVRKPEQMVRLVEQIGEQNEALTGFIFPKFSGENGAEYLKAFHIAEEIAGRKFYFMPIIESRNVLNPITRRKQLDIIYRILAPVKYSVLNVRVGGNDFCNCLGIRRHRDEPIYQIGSVSSALYDILGVFGMEYVVSGPVYEYFDGDGWREDMWKETSLDRLNGFTGKTVIHPNQIAVVNEVLQVEREDYLDAAATCKMKENDKFYVTKEGSGQRMNEFKAHLNWARKILLLAEIYGVKSYGSL